ncbi:MAG: radical SAM protein [Candidatus Omnitrophota bacterium]|nr:radical SAM protein [Candidatus Omnitrophota bacterium]
MTDLLLIHPPKSDYGKSVFKNFDTYSFLSNIAPLGLLYIAASCKNQGYSVKVLDMESEKLSLTGIRRYLRLYLPRAVGISITAPVIKNLNILSKVIKEEASIPIIVGGPFATLYPDVVLKDENIDFVIRYEGEKRLVELLDLLLRGKGSFNEIRNLSYRLDGRVINGEIDTAMEDINSLAFPAREFIPIKNYFSILTKKMPSIGIIGSRGCPYRCIFCSSVYKTSRRRSIGNIADEIEKTVKSYNIRNFDFFDPVFNLDNRWVIDLCSEIIKRKLNISWRARCRPDLIEKYAVLKMEEASCQVISLSIESSNNNTLKFLKKGYIIEDVVRAIEIIRLTKIDIHGYFIVGCPNETKQDMLNTIKFAKETKIDYVDFHILTPFAGSELFSWNEDNKTNPGSRDLDNNPLIHPTLSHKDIKKMYMKAISSFYLRPSWITKEFIRLIKNPRRYLNIVCYLMASIARAYKNRNGSFRMKAP